MITMSSEHPPVIELRDVVKTYGIGDAETHALDKVNLRVAQGEFIAIMGPSGCGKTTLLNIIGMLDTINDGDYLLDGKNIAKIGSTKRARIRAEQIGIVFQNFNLIERMNVIENVALPLTYHGMPHLKRLEAASKVLKAFHLSEREYYLPSQLSGGQMQRVAIARALVNSPSLILADEPTGNLDSRSSHVIMEELAELHAQGNTILMVTHNPGLTSYASRVINMLDGRIASDRKIRVVNTSKPQTIALHKPRKTAPLAEVAETIKKVDITDEEPVKKSKKPAKATAAKAKAKKQKSQKSTKLTKKAAKSTRRAVKTKSAKEKAS